MERLVRRESPEVRVPRAVKVLLAFKVLLATKVPQAAATKVLQGRKAVRESPEQAAKEPSAAKAGLVLKVRLALRE